MRFFKIREIRENPRKSSKIGSGGVLEFGRCKTALSGVLWLLPPTMGVDLGADRFPNGEVGWNRGSFLLGDVGLRSFYLGPLVIYPVDS